MLASLWMSNASLHSSVTADTKEPGWMTDSAETWSNRTVNSYTLQFVDVLETAILSKLGSRP